MAISFVQNLFFTINFISQRPGSSQNKNKSKDRFDKDSHTLAWLLLLYYKIMPITLLLLSIVLVLSIVYIKYCIAILLIPYLLLFVPAVLRPTSSLTSTSIGTTKLIRIMLLGDIQFFSGTLQGFTLLYRHILPILPCRPLGRVQIGARILHQLESCLGQNTSIRL